MPGRITGPMPERIIEYLGACGRFLHYKMGEKAGRRRIFTILSKAKELPQRELQDILGICSGSLSEILAKMEADGFLEKAKSKTDGRQLNLRLTDAGKSCGAGKGLPAQSSEDGSLPFQGRTGEPPENADGPSGMLVGFGSK